MNVVRHHISAGEFEQVIHMFRPRFERLSVHEQSSYPTRTGAEPSPASTYSGLSTSA